MNRRPVPRLFAVLAATFALLTMRSDLLAASASPLARAHKPVRTMRLASLLTHKQGAHVGHPNVSQQVPLPFPPPWIIGGNCYDWYKLLLEAYLEFSQGQMGYMSQQPEQVAFEGDFVPDARTLQLAVVTPDSAIVSINGVAVAYGQAPPPVIPAPYSSVAPYVRPLNVNLVPRQSYHLRVVYDSTATFVPGRSGIAIISWGCDTTTTDPNPPLPPASGVKVIIHPKTQQPNPTGVGQEVSVDLPAQVTGSIPGLPATFNWTWALVRDPNYSLIGYSTTPNGPWAMTSCLYQYLTPITQNVRDPHSKLVAAFDKAGYFKFRVGVTSDPFTINGMTYQGLHDERDVIIHVVDDGQVHVAFTASQVTAGISKIGRDLRGSITAYITPASQAASVKFDTTFDSNASVAVDSTANVGNSQQVTLKITGIEPGTVAGAASKLHAHGPPTNVLAEAKIFIPIPMYDTHKDGVPGIVNMIIGGLPFTLVGQTQIITIQDQFHNPLDVIYDGKDVVQGEFINIQGDHYDFATVWTPIYLPDGDTLKGGTKKDLTGRNTYTQDFTVPANKVTDWGNFLYPLGGLYYNVFDYTLMHDETYIGTQMLMVDGWPITPNYKRTMFLKKSNNLGIFSATDVKQ